MSMEIHQVFGSAHVAENAEVYGNSEVYGSSKVFGYAQVYGDSEVYGNAQVFGKSQVYGEAKIYRLAKIYDNAQITGNALVCGNAEIGGKVIICDNLMINKNALIHSKLDYIFVDSLGHNGHSIIFFREKDGWSGSWKGSGKFDFNSIDNFRKAVKELYGESLIAKEYLLLADLVEVRAERNKQL